MNWTCKKFEELTLHELYALLQLRNVVFVVEQNCVYPDLDDQDQRAYHFMGWQNDKLCAYTRIIPGNNSAGGDTRIGRVVTAPHARRKGLGRELMEQSIKKSYELFGTGALKIGAQVYLKQFYTSLGFIQTGEIHLEDGIEHMEMLLPAPRS